MGKTIISDIAGGTKPIERDIGDAITIQHLWSMYRWYPGYRDMINLEVDAIFSNGFNEKEIVDTARLSECKESVRWSIMAGYSIILADARDPDNKRLEAWHPYIDGIGYQIIKTSPKGHPTKIKVYTNANETEGGGGYTIPHYPCKKDIDGEYITSEPEEGGYGFFSLRTQGNLKGIQGLPQHLHLIDPLKIQWDIIKAYGPYAEKQGMAFPAVGLDKNTQANRTSVKSQFANQPTTNRLLIMGNEDIVEWISPQAGAYDPFPMLQWINTIISRATQMNRLMLEGDPAGYLSASETSVNNWESKLGEKQDYWLTQIIGPLKAMGCSDEINFQDAAKPTFISLMEGLKAVREALDGLVEPEDIVNIFNVYLAKNDQEVELHALPKEEIMNNNMEEEKDGNPGRDDNQGSKE